MTDQPLYRAKSWSAFAAAGLATLLIGLAPGLASARVLSLYVAPNGSMSADGTKKEQAVPTLARAIEIAKQRLQPDVSAVEVHVAPGVYKDQQLKLAGTPGGLPLSLLGAAGKDNARPQFQGKGEGTWLSYSSNKHDKNSLKVSGFEVSNYRTAISLNGSRKNKDSWNGGHEITNNVFMKIGQSSEAVRPSTAAIRLVNSRNNKIVGNTFNEIRNVQQCNLLHAVYVAHYSSGNLISNNTFDGGCGAVIKVRDASNGNKIVQNKFLNQELEAVQDSFCDKSKSSMCTRETPECPSWDNVVESNAIATAAPDVLAARTAAAGKKMGQPKVAVVKGQAAPPGCDAPPGEGRRIRSVQNQYMKK
ncbi:hypothetical protein [Bordetella petrii]|uniref:hypothetical protein n=1 Tax=Bordetella petrii TaxID=94624 RepID=UPI0037338635